MARLAGALADAGHDVEVWCYAGKSDNGLVRTKTLRPKWLGSGNIIRHYAAPIALNLRGTDHLDVLHLFGDDWFFVRRRVATVRTMLGSAIMEAVTTQSIRRRAEQTLIFGLEQVSACLADAVYGIGQDSQTLDRGDGILGSGVVPITSPPTWEARPTILFVGAWDGRKRGAMLHHVFVDGVLPRVPDAQLWMVADRTEQTPGVRWFEHPTDGEGDPIGIAEPGRSAFRAPTRDWACRTWRPSRTASTWWPRRTSARCQCFMELAGSSRTGNWVTLSSRASPPQPAIGVGEQSRRRRGRAITRGQPSSPRMSRPTNWHKLASAGVGEGILGGRRGRRRENADGEPKSGLASAPPRSGYPVDAATRRAASQTLICGADANLAAKTRLA